MGAGALMKPRKPQQTADTELVAKLRGEGEGPVVFTRGEVKQLLAAFDDLTGMVQGVAAELSRHNLQMVPTMNHDDGSVSFDLQPAPPDDEPPVAEPVMN